MILMLSLCLVPVSICFPRILNSFPTCVIDWFCFDFFYFYVILFLFFFICFPPSFSMFQPEWCDGSWLLVCVGFISVWRWVNCCVVCWSWCIVLVRCVGAVCDMSRLVSLLIIWPLWYWWWILVCYTWSLNKKPKNQGKSQNKLVYGMCYQW